MNTPRVATATETVATAGRVSYGGRPNVARARISKARVCQTRSHRPLLSRIVENGFFYTRIFFPEFLLWGACFFSLFTNIYFFFVSRATGPFPLEVIERFKRTSNDPYTYTYSYIYIYIISI